MDVLANLRACCSGKYAKKRLTEDAPKFKPLFSKSTSLVCAVDNLQKGITHSFHKIGQEDNVMIHATNCIAIERPPVGKNGIFRKKAKDLQGGFINASPLMKDKI